jgi:hypothetical protein
MEVVTVLLLVLSSIFTGFLLTLIYMVWRMLRSEGWDNSNMTNALRLIAHTTLHAEDFLKMYYISDEMKAVLNKEGMKPDRPFWYLDKDELSEVVDTRPKS